jgi:hypothetical protein
VSGQAGEPQPERRPVDMHFPAGVEFRDSALAIRVSVLGGFDRPSPVQGGFGNGRCALSETRSV